MSKEDIANSVSGQLCLQHVDETELDQVKKNNGWNHGV